MKFSNTFLNAIDKISIAGWDKDNRSSKKNLPTHGGNVDIKFHDGSSIRLPLAMWNNPKAEGNRPTISGTLDLYKMDMLMDTIEKFTGDCPIDNPSLRSDRVARTDDEHANRDEVHDKATAKKIARKAG
jgi:hypothetical protein